MTYEEVTYPENGCLLGILRHSVNYAKCEPETTNEEAEGENYVKAGAWVIKDTSLALTAKCRLE